MSLLPLVRRCILPVELDDVTLEFLTTLIQEEVDFLKATPRCMTRTQLLHILNTKLQETLVTYEIAETQAQAKVLCELLVDELVKAKMIELAPGGVVKKKSIDTPTTTGSTSANTTAASSSSSKTSPSTSSSSSSSSSSRLAAPVCLNELAKADAALNTLEFSMADIISVSSRAHWSAAEESVLFQSLADAPDDDDDDDEEAEVEGGCEMCTRVMHLTRHHLIPRSQHNTSPYSRMSTTYLNVEKIAMICRQCHSAVHKFADNATLAKSYHSIPLLMADERMQRWAEYIKKRRVVFKPKGVHLKNAK